ncbi:PREDICTED: peroxisomal membrane protein 11C [Ceratosolen solmsi marchali]|uniref:Peroxisomal membrane protein 11C n=1 Tax=Ceratosolen solmsi marchali TaxID=326594 RepID=A0AAJ6YIA2_9HYME|nr:PREDICTED: peroxisomal membrane protein 11C [Ceratosolen solmsi marchali]
MNIASISEYLETYEGRDKFLRTLSYAAKLASGFSSSHDTAIKFKKFGSKMSGARVILRLLDDIPNIHRVKTYTLRQKHSDWIIRFIEVFKIALDLFYSPIEHIYWAGENKLIQINVVKWNRISVWFWIFSLYLALIKSLRRYKLLKKQELLFSKVELNPRFDKSKLKDQQSSEMLICLRLLLDLSYAINYLPSGTLWGGKFSDWQVGALGTISSLIGIYQALSKIITQKAS